MKLIKRISAVILIMVLMSTTIVAVERVVCEVDVKSDTSAQVTLNWNTDNDDNIRITSWSKIDDETLKVYYISGDDVISGWNSVLVQGEGYSFPMKVVLSEQGSDDDTFSDLPSTYEEKYSILNLYYRNIISGYPDGSFRPDKLVTRAEFAKMITVTASYELESDTRSTFSDVSDSYWGSAYIMTLANKEILKGRTNGTFDPSGNITIGEVLTVINRTFILYDNDGSYPYALESHWSNNNFLEMVDYNVVHSSDDFYYPYTADEKATRSECAVLLSRVLEQLHEVN